MAKYCRTIYVLTLAVKSMCTVVKLQLAALGKNEESRNASYQHYFNEWETISRTEEIFWSVYGDQAMWLYKYTHRIFVITRYFWIKHFQVYTVKENWLAVSCIHTQRLATKSWQMVTRSHCKEGTSTWAHPRCWKLHLHCPFHNLNRECTNWTSD